MLVKQTMTFVRAVSITALVALGSLAQVALADDATATKTIAGVLAGLNHFPSAEDIKRLLRPSLVMNLTAWPCAHSPAR